LAVEVRELTVADLEALAARLRPADEEELRLCGVASPLNALCSSYAVSTEAWAGLVDGRVVAAFGAAPRALLAGSGTPWLLASKDLERPRVARAFLRYSRPLLSRMRGRHPGGLRNWVWTGNRAAVRWLGWLGAAIEPAERWGPHRAHFHPFTL
jgi:hypothetical protein